MIKENDEKKTGFTLAYHLDSVYACLFIPSGTHTNQKIR